VNEPGIEQEGDEPDSSPDFVELSTAEPFSPAPQDAHWQRQASAEGPRKRVHASYPNGKSDRTIRRHKKAKRDLEAQGFFSLPEFFKRRAESARQQEAIEVVHEECEERASCKEHEDNANEVDDGAKVIGSTCSAEGGMVSIHVLEERDEADDDDDEVMGSLCNVKDGTTSIQLEEEEETDEAEDEAGKTMGGACSAKGGTMSIHGHSSGDPSDLEQEPGYCWGPSRTVLYESEESSSSSCSGDTLGDLEELHGTDHPGSKRAASPDSGLNAARDASRNLKKRNAVVESEKNSSRGVEWFMALPQMEVSSRMCENRGQ